MHCLVLHRDESVEGYCFFAGSFLRRDESTLHLLSMCASRACNLCIPYTELRDIEAMLIGPSVAALVQNYNEVPHMMKRILDLQWLQGIHRYIHHCESSASTDCRLASLLRK